MKFLTSSLVDPLRDYERLRIMIAGMIGIFGVALMGLTLSYSIAGWDLTSNLIYQILRLGLVGTVGTTMTFWLAGRKRGRWYILLLQLFGMTMFVFGNESPWFCGFADMLVNGAFWAVYNVRFAKKQSLDNNVREFALAQVLTTLAGAAGTWLGGYLLQMDLRSFGIEGGVLCLIVATQATYRFYEAPNVTREALSLIPRKKPSSRMTLFGGMLSVFQTSCLPIWFRHVGISPLSTGTMLALQSLLSFFLMPVVGNFVQKGTLGGARVGSFLIIVAWFAMYGALSNPWILAPILGLMQIGYMLVVTAEATRWFKMRSPIAIAARENVLAAGRVGTYCVVLPIVFLSPFAFPLAAIGTSFLCIFGIISLKRKGKFGVRGDL